MANEVRKLDDAVGSRLRKSQIITKISDIVRELVDNSVDADAHAIQVFLDNYGLKRIEVKDTGHGIPADDVQLIVSGGHTSKLKDDHLSCDQQYGFRGEALAAISSFSNIVITTKTAQDSCANKYVFDNSANILTKNKVALGIGTNILVKNLFENFPVRKTYISDPNVCKNDLKEIESYCKSVGLVNYRIFISLYHNGSLIWSKPSVKSIEQSLATVFGVNLANKLSKCPTVTLSSQSEQNENHQPSWTGKLDIFVPSPPVDMKVMGFTNNKMLMIFVNRRRVFIKEYEKLIKSYVVESAATPTQAEQRKFPLAVVMIEVPPNEVDFNRDVDKSKIFLTCRDLIRTKLLEALQSLYGVNLEAESNALNETSNTTFGNLEDETAANINTSADGHMDVDQSEAPSAKKQTPNKNFVEIIKPVASTPEKRRENILSFLENLPCASKTTDEAISNEKSSGKIITTKGKDRGAVKKFLSGADISTDKSNMNFNISADKLVIIESDELIVNSTPTANFTISVDEIILDDTPTQLPISSDPSNLMSSSESNNTDLSSNNNNVSATAANLNSTPVVSSTTRPPQSHVLVLSGFTKPPSALNKSFSGVTQQSATSNFRTFTPPPPKKLKLFETPVDIFSRGSSQASRGGEKKPRQITLESLKNWPATPRSNMSTTSALRNKQYTSFPAKVSLKDIDIDATLIPQTMKYLESQKSPQLPSKDSSNSKVSERKSLVGLVANINLNLTMEKSMECSRQEQEEGNNPPKIVSHLSGTNYYVVKVDGLLGCFNPSKVLELRPHLKYQLFPNNDNSLELDSTFSDESVISLLQEFVNIAETLDRDTASAAFNVFLDLE